jgi:hypothetical protein
MPLTLSGTNGVSGIDGSAGTPTERGSDADTGVFYPSAGAIGFSNNGVQTMTLDASGNLGVGTASPNYNAVTGTVVHINNSAAGAWTVNRYTNGSTGAGAADGAIIGMVGTTGYVFSYENDAIIFGTNSAERARIDSSGNLLVGTTSVGAYTGAAVTLSRDSGTTKWSVGPTSGTPTNFWIASSGSTGVYLNGTSATSWTSNSDERIKENLSPIDNALNKTLTLRTVTGNFIEDETKTPHAFLLAQDVLAVLPEAVDTSNPNKYGLAYSEVIPLAIAAIKELSAKNDALEARIAALEAN